MLVLSIVWMGCSVVPQAQADVPSHLAWPDNPEELGRVSWNRGFAEAKQLAKTQGKPLLVLFDEVPGCSTVRAYGRGTLSDPLVVDAAEALFVPVVVYNNVRGDDRQVLEHYREPAWNNPVVRVMDADGADLVPRLTGDWSRGALLSRMESALRKAKQPVPDWLSLVAWEDRTAASASTATYSMGCFWSGEAHLGAHDAVLSTRTGWAGGREVVELTFDPTRTTEAALDRFARSGGTTRHEGHSLRATPNDDRYEIRGTPWGAVPMTAGQASRVNADVAANRDPSRWLSPRQLAIHAEAVALGGGWHAGLGQIPLSEGFEQATAAIARRR
ncbi:MAG: hypothetical protein KTR31_24050 [Myxococcales bacterium]|nr:hypothetical protein [Myxococcales bacterium]